MRSTTAPIGLSITSPPLPRVTEQNLHYGALSSAAQTSTLLDRLHR
jgi:hypothetical protein